MNVLEELHIPIVSREDIPAGFIALTDPILVTQEEIISSIWWNLSCTETVVTLSDGQVQFWRVPVKPVKSRSKRCEGVVRTR